MFNQDSLAILLAAVERATNYWLETATREDIKSAFGPPLDLAT